MKNMVQSLEVTLQVYVPLIYFWGPNPVTSKRGTGCVMLPSKKSPVFSAVLTHCASVTDRRRTYRIVAACALKQSATYDAALVGNYIELGNTHIL